MAEKKEEKISPAIVIIPLGLGLVAVVGLALAAAAKAAPPGAEFTVSNLIINPEEVNPGQPVTISCTVTNTGSEAGSYTVNLGGDFIAQQTVTLQPGESQVVSFQVTPTEAGTYHISADGLSGTFIATTAPVADIRVENLVISPTEVYVGQPVTISVQVTNYGTAAGTKTIICTVS